MRGSSFCCIRVGGVLQKERQQQASDHAAPSQPISSLTQNGPHCLVRPDRSRTFSPLPVAILLRVCLTTATLSHLPPALKPLQHAPPPPPSLCPFPHRGCVSTLPAPLSPPSQKAQTNFPHSPPPFLSLPHRDCVTTATEPANSLDRSSAMQSSWNIVSDRNPEHHFCASQYPVTT